jgi:hypothetical protein
MSYQQVRAYFEAPVIAALQAMTPPVPVYVDNQPITEADAAKEHARIRFDFGTTTETALAENVERLRGNVVVECYASKGKGPARAQLMITEAIKALNGLARCGPKPATGAHGRTREITGPSFYAMDGTPFFVARVGCGFDASYT